ncbi:MAG TPA: hypothetical protein VMS38_28165, partial [Pseudorhodoferax sp.]|nr:hypothetical protein [Pseudorhodoferax sp.]
WHRFVPEELDERELDQADWSAWMNAEARVFEQVRAQVSEQLDAEEQDQQQQQMQESRRQQERFMREQRDAQEQQQRRQMQERRQLDTQRERPPRTAIQQERWQQPADPSRRPGNRD